MPRSSRIARYGRTSKEKEKYCVYDFSKYLFIQEKKSTFRFLNSRLDIINHALITHSQRMLEVLILIYGMKIMFVCRVQNISFLWVGIILDCSLHYFLLIKKNKEPIWPMLTQLLKSLKSKCDHQEATIEDLKVNIFIFTVILMKEILQ